MKQLSRSRVREFCKRNAVSENVFFLTAFSVCVSIFADTDDVACSGIHNGRTDSRWSRAAGPLFRTSIFRYKEEEHESVAGLLKRIGNEMLENMKRRISTLHINDMFFQYQGDLERVAVIGEAAAERIPIDTDDIPFHLIVIPDDIGYSYTLKFRSSRFERELVKVFLEVVNDISYALLEESTVARLKHRIDEKHYPVHFRISAEELNSAAGKKIISGVADTEEIKVYVLDKKYEKTPYGAWGTLYLLDHKTEGREDSAVVPYAGGSLYNTGRKARISPDGKVEFIERAGRNVLLENTERRRFIDLAKIEQAGQEAGKTAGQQAAKEYPAVKGARAYVGYGDNNEMKLALEISSSTRPDEEDLKRYLERTCGHDYVPSELILNDF